MKIETREVLLGFGSFGALLFGAYIIGAIGENIESLRIYCGFLLLFGILGWAALLHSRIDG